MPAQYIIGTNREDMDQALKAQGWNTYGRISWLKPDGTEVRHLQRVDQLVGVESGDTVHVVGHPAKLLTALDGSGAIIVKV